MARILDMICEENLTLMDVYNIFDYATDADEELHALNSLSVEQVKNEEIMRGFRQRAIELLDDIYSEDTDLWFEVICCLELTAQMKEATYEQRGA